MKSFGIYIITSMILVSTAFGQADSTIVELDKVEWKNSSATVLKPGRIEVGVAGPLVIGLKHNMELSTHKLLFFVAPNLKLKKNWSKTPDKSFQIATEHSFTVPTLLLNLLATDGTIGVYPPNETAPPILTFRNRFIGTHYYHRDHAVSIKAGIEFNVLYSKYKDFQEVELLYIYPRTASYSNPFVAEFAVGLVGKINDRMNYDGDLTVFFIPRDENVWVYEFNPKLYYSFSNKFRIAAGVNLTAGNVPNEKQNFRALPFVDFQWALFQNR